MLNGGTTTLRRLFHGCCLLSLVLGLAVAVFWAVGGSLQLVRPLGIEINADGGILHLNHYDNWPQPPPPEWRYSGFRFYYAPDPAVPWVYAGEGGGQTWGVFRGHVSIRPQALSSTTATQRVERWEVAAPFWLIVLCLLGPPIVAAARASKRCWRTRDARRAGGIPCPRCGYDLRATAGPTCPECGEAAASTRSA